jgi:hypothetical protein
MYVNGTFRDANLTNCVLKNNYSHGLYTNSNADNFVVNASNIESNGGSGVESHGQRGIFTNNTYKNNAGIGCDTTGDYCIVGKSIGFNNSYAFSCRVGCNVCDNRLPTAPMIVATSCLAPKTQPSLATISTMQATPTETRAQTHLQTTTNLKLNRRHV